MKLPTNHKALFIYGYILPFLGAFSFTAFLPLISPHFYCDVFFIFRENKSLVFLIISLFIAIASPFQSKIFTEDSVIVLYVLEKSEIRRALKDAFFFQSVTIIFTLLFLFIFVPVLFSNEEIAGLVMFFCLILIFFESLSMISNGRAYENIREKILKRMK